MEHEKTDSKRKALSVLMRVSIALIYLIVVGVGSLIVFTRVRQMAAASEMLPSFTMNDEGPSPNIEYVEGETLPTWTGTDRITVLILGIDERAQWDEPAWRTDTMMIATLDPVTLQAGVLSIPRDLWVEIPTSGYNRINTAHFIGDIADYPGGGPALAVETVKRNLGIEIDYYVRLNFQAFVDFVDQIGGIDIYVEETIDDPLYPDYNYGYDPLYIEAGQHHFYGELALKYARTRHSGNGDFDRARRQQQVVSAVLKKITNPATLPQLVARTPEIYNTIADSIATDFKVDQGMALASLAREIDVGAIRFAVIDETCTQFAFTPDEAQVLIPIRECIREKRDFIFGIDPAPAAETVAQEDASITVLNGAGVEGLAGSTVQYLESNGLKVAAFDNADRQDYNSSLVILYRDKSLTAQQIIMLLDLPQSAIVKTDDPSAPYDIVVILGQDYAGKINGINVTP